MRRLLVNFRGALGSLRKAATGSQHIAMPIRRGPILSLILCGGLMVAAIIVGTMMMVGEFRERALSNNERELENTVLLLTRHFEQQFEDTEIIANDVISRMQFSEIDSPETFRIWMSSHDAHLILKSKVNVLSYIGDVGIFDADGKLINSSATWPLPAISIADRAYFKNFKSDAALKTAVAEPARSQMTGDWSTVIAHRLSGRNGVFLGVMARRIDPAHFEKFFASVALGNGAAISMFHRDGTMLARYPHANSMIGQKFRNAPLLNKVLTEGGRQTLRVQSPVDGTDRLGSAAPLSRLPIVVVATTTVSAALADWQAQTRFMVAAAVLSALVIAFVLFLIIRQVTRQNQESQQRLGLQKQQLDTALNNMTQGLVLYDASARIILCNQRYIDMYGLSTDIVKPGCHFRDLIQHRQDTGSFDGDVDEFCSAIMRNVAQGKVTHMTMETAGAFVSDRQQAAGAGRMGRHDRRHHRAPEPAAGARPQLCVPAPDHRSHSDADHRQGPARWPLRAGQSGGRDPIRAAARGNRRQDRVRSVSEAGRRQHRRGRRKGPEQPRRPVPGRVPVADPGASASSRRSASEFRTRPAKPGI